MILQRLAIALMPSFSLLRSNFCWYFPFDSNYHLRQSLNQGAWVAQSIKHLTLAQVMISWFVGLSPVSGCLLTAQSLEPASDSVFSSLSSPPPTHVLCLSKFNKHLKKNFLRQFLNLQNKGIFFLIWSLISSFIAL